MAKRYKRMEKYIRIYSRNLKLSESSKVLILGCYTCSDAFLDDARNVLRLAMLLDSKCWVIKEVQESKKNNKR